MRADPSRTSKASRASLVLCITMLTVVMPTVVLMGCKRGEDKADTSRSTVSASAAPSATTRGATSAARSTAWPRATIDSTAPDAGAALSWALPDKLGRFIGGPVEVGSYYIRRPYADTRAQMEVTISDARSPSLKRSPRGEPSEFFLRESSAYPQISLDLPKGTGSGFYDCVEMPAGQRCSGYILLFDGFHVEVLNGDATRADIDVMIAALPLRALATLR